jgi:hypothetical protein
MAAVAVTIACQHCYVAELVTNTYKPSWRLVDAAKCMLTSRSDVPQRCVSSAHSSRGHALTVGQDPEAFARFNLRVLATYQA